jgi:hypothetical protein
MSQAHQTSQLGNCLQHHNMLKMAILANANPAESNIGPILKPESL